MAAYAGVASLLNNIEQMMSHPLLSTSFDNKQIESLHGKADGLLQFMNYGGMVMSKEAEDLERGIACAAHAAEDVIESHIVDRIHAGSCEASTVDLQQIIQDMDAILKKVDELKEKHAIKEEQPTNPRTSMGTGESGMVGFDDELLQLLDELTNQQSSRHIISIVGMGGAGKTTLAQNVYQNLLIKQHFDIRAWATASQQYNAQEILSQLLPSQGKSSDKTIDELGEELHKTLWGRRYLIILDDLWSIKAWDEVRRFFPDNGNRSRVVLTTRLSNVARDCHSHSCLIMKPLDEHKSWILFCKMAFQQETCPYPELEEVGKEIARMCRGLPLSTIVIGRLLLKSPRTVEFWEKVVRDIQSVPDSKEKEEILDILCLSYNHLPSHLKPCFLYMGVFKDSSIRVSKIINLWIAEGFVRPHKNQILEEVAEGYLKELIDRNLILISKHGHNGKIGSCGIHDLLRDLCLRVGEQQEFFHVSEDEIRGTERRLICSNLPGLLSNGPQLARSVFSGGAPRHQIRNICLLVDRLFEILDEIERGRRGTEEHARIPSDSDVLGQLAHSPPEENALGQPFNHKLLRVWDERFESETEFHKNVNLRFLDYKLPTFHRDMLLEFPASVLCTWNLQTLIIGGSHGLPYCVYRLKFGRCDNLGM